MSVLLSLPTEVANEILSEWLTINSWKFFDTAVSGRVLRISLLEQFKLLSAPSAYGLDYTWITTRGIKLKQLDFGMADISPSGFLNFTVDTAMIETLVIHYGTDYSSASIVNGFSNLKSLDVANPAIITNLSSELCSKLQSLNISFWSTESMLFIKKHCKSLKRFTVSGYEADDAVFDVVKANPKLEHIEMGGSEDVLEYFIANTCEYLRSIRLFLPNFVISDVVRLISGRSLEWLKINDVFEYRAKDRYLYLRDFENGPDLITIVSSFPELKQIMYDGLYDQSDEMLRVVIGHSADTLEDFNIGISDDLTVTVLIELLKRCQRLRKLVVFHNILTNAEVLQLFSPEVPNKLETLMMQGGIDMDLKTIIELVHNCPYLTYCHMLRVPRVIVSEEEERQLDELKFTQEPHASNPLRLDIEWISEEGDEWYSDDGWGFDVDGVFEDEEVEDGGEYEDYDDDDGNGGVYEDLEIEEKEPDEESHEY